MAYTMYFDPATTMTGASYDEATKRLAEAGQGMPAGRLYHVAYGTGDDVKVFDVWESMEAFDAFGATLMPILGELGVDPGQPQVNEVRNIIVG